MAVSSSSDSSPGSPAICDKISTKYEGGDTLLSPSQMNNSFQSHEKSEGESATQSFDSREPTPDPNIIDWEPDDRQNPKNWPLSRKWIMISIVSVNTLMTALGSTIPTPGVPQLMKEFHSDNDLLESFVISVYALGFAFVIAPLSETYGRLPVYLTCNLSFLMWCIACAVAPNMAALVIFRFLAGAFGAAPFTLGGGTIADIVDPAQRGTAMGIWMGGLTVGPVIGPTIGGFISAYLGWRWTFWILSMIAGVICGISIIFMRETFARVLLARKVQRLRKESGNQDLKSRLDKEDSTATLLRLSFIRPAKMFFKSVIVCLLCIYVAIVYTIMFILFTTFTTVFEGQYGIPTSTSGLLYLGWGIGSIIGQATYTTVSNRFVARSIANCTFKPEDRLPLRVPGGILLPVGLIWYGWSAQAEVHWIVPIIGTAVAAIGLTIVFAAPLAYLIDVFTVYAASAIGANVVLRSLCAAVIPLCGQKLYDKLGIGWGNTLLALVVLGCVPINLAFYFYGENIRKRYPLVNL
ncbi:multidrug resistance protein [Penicillium herquei]|nr:multidrug resistance protein [Penicillium herquei]